MLGPDVSSWQSGVDWRAVFASGRHFCFFKTNEGGTFTDPDAARNRAAAKAAGFILRGLYDFARLGTPEAQADFYCDDVVTLEAGEVAVLDAEVHGLTADWCVRWADRVRARLGAGIVTALYCSESYYWDDLRGDPRLNDRFTFKWIAKYRLDYQLVMSSDPRPSIPGALFWQYTDRATIPGIGSCDESVFDGTDADLAALVGATIAPVPEEDPMAVRYALPNGQVFATDGLSRRYVGSPLENDVLNDIGVKLVVINPDHVQGFHDNLRDLDGMDASYSGLVSSIVAAVLAGLPATTEVTVDADALAARVVAGITFHIDAPSIADSVSKVLGSKLSA